MLLPGCSDTICYSGLANIYLFIFVLFLDSNCGVFFSLFFFFLLMKDNSKNVRLVRCVSIRRYVFPPEISAKWTIITPVHFLTPCVIFDYAFTFPCTVARIKRCWTITCMFASHTELVLERKCCYVFILLHHYNAVLTLM